MATIVSTEYIPFSPPNITDEEIQAVVDTLRSPWITTGPQTKTLEKEFAAMHGAEACLALNSCTAGMHVALMTLGVGPGDEVIVPTHTFCATANVVEHVGARPIIVDVEPDTLNIDPEKIRAAISPRTKVIMPVHYAGHAVDLDPIQAMAEKFGVQIVEDAAHPVTGRYKGRVIGSSPNFAAFSFYATKNMTSAEGGVLTGPAELVDKARVVSLHGMDKDAWKRFDKGGSWKYDVVLPGFKYNMPDVLASLGLAQLRRLGEMQARRRHLVKIYNDGFANEPALELPTARPEVDHVWHLYVIRLNLEQLRITRDEFMSEMAERNIGCSVHYTPLHMHSFYKNKYGYKDSDFPVASAEFERIVSLPLSPAHTDEQIRTVIAVVKDVLDSARK